MASKTTDQTEDQTTPVTTLVDGSQISSPAGSGFIVRNTSAFSGMFILDGAEYDMDPQTYVIVSKKPSAMTIGIICQEL